MAPEPKYTWTFSEKAWTMRFFLWLYAPDRSKLTFCKFFWGWIATPITLPLKLIGLSATAGGHAIRSPFRRLEHFRRKRNGQHFDRRIEVWKKWKEVARPYSFRIVGHEVYYSWAPARFTINDTIHNSPPTEAVKMSKPPKPPTPERVSGALADFADHIVAWFQDRPQIGVRIGAITTWVGRAAVRFVFYPLAFLVPLTAVSFVLYEVWEHRGGGIDFAHQSWSDSVSGSHIAVNTSWEGIALSLGSGIVALSIFFVVGWILMAADKFDAPPADTRLYKAWGVGKPQPRIAVLAGNVTYRLGWLLGWAALIIVAGPFWVLYKYVLQPIGHGAQGFGKFMVLGHHSVKTRTCPRIEVRSD